MKRWSEDLRTERIRRASRQGRSVGYIRPGWKVLGNALQVLGSNARRFLRRRKERREHCGEDSGRPIRRPPVSVVAVAPGGLYVARRWPLTRGRAIGFGLSRRGHTVDIITFPDARIT
jgi:hypothetical protein